MASVLKCRELSYIVDQSAPAIKPMTTLGFSNVSPEHVEFLQKRYLTMMTKTLDQNLQCIMSIIGDTILHHGHVTRFA